MAAEKLKRFGIALAFVALALVAFWLLQAWVVSSVR